MSSRNDDFFNRHFFIPDGKPLNWCRSSKENTVILDPESINPIVLTSKTGCTNYYHMTNKAISFKRFEGLSDFARCKKVYAKACYSCNRSVWRFPEYTVSSINALSM